MGHATSTLVIEMVVVSMAVAVGAVYMADVWPSPDVPLIWMGGAAGIFFVYAVAAAVRDLRAVLRTQAVEEPAAEAGADAAELSPTQPSSDLGDAPEPDLEEEPAEEPYSPQPTLTLGAPSEEATAFLSVDELRPETDEDNMSTDIPSVPLFAESSLYSTAQLAAGARELHEQQEIEELEEIEDLEAIEDPEGIDDLEEVEVQGLEAIEDLEEIAAGEPISEPISEPAGEPVSEPREDA